jgi:hypothetical protein
MSQVRKWRWFISKNEQRRRAKKKAKSKDIDMSNEIKSV